MTYKLQLIKIYWLITATDFSSRFELGFPHQYRSLKIVIGLSQTFIIFLRE